MHPTRLKSNMTFTTGGLFGLLEGNTEQTMIELIIIIPSDVIFTTEVVLAE